MSRQGEKLTVGEFLDRWLEEVVKMRNKPRTYELYQQITIVKYAAYVTNLSAIRPLTRLF